MRQNVALLWNRCYNLHHSGNFGETSRIFRNLIRLNVDPSGLTKDTGFACVVCHACRVLLLLHFHNTLSCRRNTVGQYATISPHLHLSAVPGPSSMFFPVHSVTLLCQLFSDLPSFIYLLHISLQDIFGPCNVFVC